MISLLVNLKDRSYPIYIGEKLIEKEALLRQEIASKQLLIVSDSNVAAYFLKNLQSLFADYQCDHVLLPPGEDQKTLGNLEKIFNRLIDKNHHRNTTLIALGGGVIGDLTGFAAACYQRGVNFIQIPTTLLAQVDASVGGKTAINYKNVKNIIGAFYQPKAVYIDIDTLQTLPDDQFYSGLAEIIKAALIMDPEFFNWLEKNLAQVLAKEKSALTFAIKKACEIKIAVVMKDEREANIRAWLNFGHTFGHAIEMISNYKTYLHGQAVAIGMVLAAELSFAQGWLKREDVLRIKNILTKAGLPIRLPSSIQYAQLEKAMQLDKKTDDTGFNFVLLKGIGEATMAKVDPNLLKAIISRLG